MHLARCWIAASIACLAVAPNARSAEPPAGKPTAEKTNADAAGLEFFERKIRPLLAQHCYSCHGQGQSKGGLSLAAREAMLAGGDSGAAVALGKPEESLLIQAVRYNGDIQMPPSGKLADEEIAAFEQWLALGAPWPAKPDDSGGGIRADGAITDADRQFWSFQPIRDPATPSVQRTDWLRKPLDAFVLSRLESERLEPAGEADRRTFIRRATFDLHGLPPSAEEIEAFLADERPDAYERLIDRLLD
jgi:mono/diheme cytochrome c family protein